jgi:hypothetical protein
MLKDILAHLLVTKANVMERQVKTMAGDHERITSHKRIKAHHSRGKGKECQENRFYY